MSEHDIKLLKTMDNSDGKDIFTVFCNEKSIGKIELYSNRFHKQNQYLHLHLSEYETAWAIPLFSDIQKIVKKPLQVMVSSTDAERVKFLLAGGFVCKRKCYEMDVTAKELISKSQVTPMNAAETGVPEYDMCCRLLFDYYKQTHAKVNPLTADYIEFCECLPEKALYQNYLGHTMHFAFVEENEIAYIGSTDVNSIQSFAESLVQMLFSDYERICFECDNGDAAAMQLKGLFKAEISESFDTYILG